MAAMMVSLASTNVELTVVPSTWTVDEFWNPDPMSVTSAATPRWPRPGATSKITGAGFDTTKDTSFETVWSAELFDDVRDAAATIEFDTVTGCSPGVSSLELSVSSSLVESTKTGARSTPS